MENRTIISILRWKTEPLLPFSDGKQNHYFHFKMENRTIASILRWKTEPLLPF